jgi:hypothetical protein
MNVLKPTIAMATLLAALALPALASAESVVPPGNSAATQYTETFPSAGGNIEANHGIGGGGGSPAKHHLSPGTTHALANQGEDGRAVAALAGESPTATTGGSGSAGGGGHGSKEASGGGSGGSGSGPSAGGGSGGSSSSAAAGPAGSSGVGHVLSSATLSRSGETGIFLPLVLLAALVGSIAYAWRRRQQDSAQKT